MAQRVIIADAEIARAAEGLQTAAQSMRNQTLRLGECFLAINAEGAIASEGTLASFEGVKADLEAIAESIEGCAAGLAANASGFIADIDQIDNFVY